MSYHEKDILFVGYIKQQIDKYPSIFIFKKVVLFDHKNWTIVLCTLKIVHTIHNKRYTILQI